MTRLLRASAMAIGALALAAATSASANDLEFLTGQMLYAQCSAKSGDADYAVRSLRCASYVLGVSDAQQAAQGAGGAARVCLPATATAPSLAAAVAAFLEAHPDKRPLAAQDLVIEALGAAYPCK
jgi:Rap1a immunity proteins